MNVRVTGCLVMLLGTSFFPLVTAADEEPRWARAPEKQFAGEAAPARKTREFRGGISLEEAVNRVRESTRGRILSAEERNSEYRVRLLTPDGVVRRLRIDPDTGRILR